METRKCFDSELQMFCAEVREPSLVTLRFWRWLAEMGQLEHEVYGPAAGPYADAVQ
jgi:hypothetical protein